MRERAIAIAATAHPGRTAQGGQPCMMHPLPVMLRVATESGCIAAVLHDVVEDSDVQVRAILAGAGA